MKPRISFFAIIAALVLASLACSQAGQILTPEEATAVAGGNTGNGQGPGNGETQEGQFAVDEVVNFVGSGFLIPIMKEPGDRMAYSNAARGQSATIKGSREVDGDLWYQVTSPAGNGWVAADNLEAAEAPPTQAEGSQTPAGEGEGEAAGGPAGGFAVGDTVYLVGRNFLINLYAEAGSRTIRANQQRGEPVKILETSSVDGVSWYKIDAPTGEGWVPADNLSAEKP